MRWPSRAGPASRSAGSPSATSMPTRAAAVPVDLLTADAAGLVADPTIDVVVELIGGIEPAAGLVRAGPGVRASRW